MDLKGYLTKRQALVNRALGKFLPPVKKFPESVHSAMRYSVLGEGKRIRPILVLAACEAVGGDISLAVPAACALEMIHAYSLVHDDLPAMDNDDFRRGKPSCHKKYGEALGILTGDALLTYSFELLTRGNHDSTMRLHVIREIAHAIGTDGMIGGQVADVALTNGTIRSELIEKVNNKKTGALLAASVRIGGLIGGASPKAYRALTRYGKKIGLVFQLVDDLLDNDGAVGLYGKEKVKRHAERLTQSAQRDLHSFGQRAEPLRELAQFILTRTM